MTTLVVERVMVYRVPPALSLSTASGTEPSTEQNEPTDHSDANNRISYLLCICICPFYCVCF